jgi:hypothetical protein
MTLFPKFHPDTEFAKAFSAQHSTPERAIENYRQSSIKGNDFQPSHLSFIGTVNANNATSNFASNQSNKSQMRRSTHTQFCLPEQMQARQSKSFAFALSISLALGQLSVADLYHSNSEALRWIDTGFCRFSLTN